MDIAIAFFPTLAFRKNLIMEHIKNYIDQHKDRFLNELLDLLKIPSVSADSAYAADVM